MCKSCSVNRRYLLWIFFESSSHVSRAAIWGWIVFSEMLNFCDYFWIRSDYYSDNSFENKGAGCHNCLLIFQLCSLRRKRLFSKEKKICHFLGLSGKRSETLGYKRPARLSKQLSTCPEKLFVEKCLLPRN